MNTILEEPSALEFDGTGAYVDLGNPDSLQARGYIITLEAWIKPTAGDGLRNILAHGPAWGALMSEVFLRINNDHYQVGTWNGNTYCADYAVPTDDFGRWVHLAGVFDGNDWILYRNGREVARQATAVGAQPVGARWAIGAAGGGTDRFFAGRIRQVAVWGVQRTPAQIAQDMGGLGAGPQEGLTAYWPLDDGAGEVVRDGGPHGNAGLCLGTTWIAPRALSLNGADSYVDLGPAPQMNLNGACTLEAWIKPAAIDGLRNIVAHGYAQNPAGEVYLRIANGQYQVGSWDGKDYYAVAPVPASDVRHWVHLAGTYDGQNWILYRNGREVGRAAGARGAFPVAAPWAIGARGGGGERFFAGLVRQVAVWNIAAEPDAIAARAMGALPTGTEPGLVGYWPLDALAGTRAAPRAPEAAAGTVVNGVWGQPYLVPQARLLEDYIPGPDPKTEARIQEAVRAYDSALVEYNIKLAQWNLSRAFNPDAPKPTPFARPAILDEAIPIVPIAATGYRTVINAATSNGQPLRCRITVTATAPLTLYFADNTNAGVGPSAGATRMTDPQGALSFFVPAGQGLLIPQLKIRADFMPPGEQLTVAADQGLHRRLAGLTGNQLMGLDAAGKPLPGKAALVAPGTDPAHAGNVAQVVGHVMAVVAGGGLQSGATGTSGLTSSASPTSFLVSGPAPAPGPGQARDTAAPSGQAPVSLIDLGGIGHFFNHDVTNFFHHTLPDAVSTVPQLTTSTVQQVEGGVTSTIHTIADGTRQAVATIQSGGDVVVSAATAFSQQAERDFAVLTVYVRSAGGQLAKLTLNTADEAASFAQGLLDRIGVTVDKVLDFFKDLFGWDDILNTADVYQHLLRQLIPALQNLIGQDAIPQVQQILRKQRTTITQALDNIRESLGNRTLGNFSQMAVGAAPGQTAGQSQGSNTAASSPKLSSALPGGGVQDTWLLRQVLANITPDFGFESAPELPIANFTDRLQAAVTESGLLTDLPEAAQSFLTLIKGLAHPEDFSSVTLANIVAVTKDVALLALDLIDVLIVALLDLISAGLDGLDAVLTHPLHIPFVSDFYKSTIAPGQDLTILGLAALLAAIPVTLAYKAAHGNTPPFDPDQVQQLLSLQVPRSAMGAQAPPAVSPAYIGLKATVGYLTIPLTAGDCYDDFITALGSTDGAKDNAAVAFYGWLYNLTAAVMAIVSEPDWLLADSATPISWDTLAVPDQLSRASWVLNWIPLAGSIILQCPPISMNDRAQEWGKGLLSVSVLPAWACGIAAASMAVDADRQNGKNIWEVTGGSGWPLLTNVVAPMSTGLQFLRLKALNEEDFDLPLLFKVMLSFICDLSAGIFQGLA